MPSMPSDLSASTGARPVPRSNVRRWEQSQRIHHDGRCNLTSSGSPEPNSDQRTECDEHQECIHDDKQSGRNARRIRMRRRPSKQLAANGCTEAGKNAAVQHKFSTSISMTYFGKTGRIMDSKEGPLTDRQLPSYARLAHLLPSLLPRVQGLYLEAMLPTGR